MRSCIAIVTAGLLLAAGCDGEVKLPTLKDVKQAVGNTVEVAKQTVNLAGGIELTLDKTIQPAGCYVTLDLQSGGRPNVLQITSYNSPSAESFPSFFFRGHVTRQSAAELSGQQVPGQLFLQESADGVVWQSPDNEPVVLEVSTVDEGVLKGTLRGTLLNLATDERKPLTGSLTGNVTKRDE